ncbi:hypothetical protein B0T24DRAFT_258868 [Lasiosphaeria ovina]|uniref:AB hydrolase-1 domain-containing protein n=1 Tax=Lasiosphaeria ovina TaxID=92902 RepID=A0AAE0KC36_9PEZI|nr:hypothetical protein B0T24DRAFT_258868 [Lasiosphaeria ovina]
MTKEEQAVVPAIPAPPAVSVRTVHMTGLLVDVYGLDEVAASSASRISCLWLHHPRLRKKEVMADIAARCVDAWWKENADSAAAGAASSDVSSSGGSGGGRGLIALAFDQRNHGTRLVHEPANGAWREGNQTHAQDMFGTIAGTVADQIVLLDSVSSYLFHDGEDGGQPRTIDHHVALGISLGGHSVWQLMFVDPRVRAGVVVVGCPDFQYLIADRAKKSKRATYLSAREGAGDDGAPSFFGSRDFPPALVESCRKADPKGILFGTSSVPDLTAPPLPEAADNRDALRQALHDRLRGKRFLLCSGGDDKLVPYRCSEPFLQWFKEATGSLFQDEGISVDDRVYPGIGHTFSPAMVKDSIRFVVGAVASAGRGDPAAVADGAAGDEQRASKI